MRQVIANVVSNREIMPGTHAISFRAPEIAGTARPGEFLMVRCSDDQDPLLRRPFSVHRVIDGVEVVVLYNVVGRGTWLLSQIREGDRVDLLGPLGEGFRLDRASRRILLVAGGVGIAPLVFLANVALEEGREVVMLVGAPTASLVYPRSLLPSAARVVTATEDGSEGRRGLATDMMCELVDDVDQVFACGPVGMYRSMAEQTCLEGKPVQVSLEAIMGCGVGACYGCTIRTGSVLRQVCRDGPVFELGDIVFAKNGDISW
jgi:dihydroorotate dehydrogenase electron transfer subunit